MVVTQSNVNALIDMKLEKYKNLREECGFYWREIADGTLKFNRKQAEVLNLNLFFKQRSSIFTIFWFNLLVLYNLVKAA